ncbi:MAG: FAD-binding oxidoreductase [Deltaproteobacteria bacterium]|jgi:FAD/FMN-containing dehydrogenase|nr:FAD-binding oxidoreductase [Deltaproteobacteria bacterium]
MLLSGWGNYPLAETTLITPNSWKDACQGRPGPRIARGLGRAYGDSAVSPGETVSTERCNAFLSFDPLTGSLVAESGVTLAEILKIFSPRGFFPPVTPGTKFVTLGGAVASDVHGKNHHVAGSFGKHVLFLDLWTPRDGLVRISPEENPDLFWGTIGGHGLTGFIARVALKLIKIPSIYIQQTLKKAQNISEIMDLFENSTNFPYSVAWIDCQKGGKHLGRSLFMAGDFLDPEELGPRKHPFKFTDPVKISVPFNFPSIALNKFNIKLFNSLYYDNIFGQSNTSIIHYNKFFYPLDAILNWNRIYGKRGFLQYQFVLPRESSRQGIPEILQKIIKIGTGTFLAVLKLFGEQTNPPGNISFPRAGYTLALDFPISRSLLSKLTELDEIVLAYQGRHYLTKDSRLAPQTFLKSYDNLLQKFLCLKSKYDPKNLFKSYQAERLNLLA